MTKARTLADNFAADINAVTANAPLTGGGTSGTVTVGIQAGTTAQSGAVQLTDSTASTSITTAATPNSVKSAYDLANGAIAKSLVDAKGDLLVGTANDTVSRLAVASTAGYVLTVDSAEATGLKWAAAGASFVGVSASNGSITTSGGGNTNITFDTETYDTDNFHSTSSSTQNFTIPTGKSGKYLFILTLFWNTGSGIREVYVRKNGSPFRRYDQYTPNGTNSQVIAEVYNLSAGDVIFSEVYNLATNTLVNAFCQITYLGA